MRIRLSDIPVLVESKCSWPLLTDLWRCLVDSGTSPVIAPCERRPAACDRTVGCHGLGSSTAACTTLPSAASAREGVVDAKGSVYSMQVVLEAPHRYESLCAIWHHTELPATRQMQHLLSLPRPLLRPAGTRFIHQIGMKG